MASVTEIQQASMWAYRSLNEKDPALRQDLLRSPTQEYTVPASAGLVGLICHNLGVDPVKGNEGDEVWRHLRGRPVASVYEFYLEAQQASRNDDMREVYRLIREVGSKHPDALAEQS